MKEKLRIIALATKLANDYDYVPDWVESSVELFEEYGKTFSHAELEVTCRTFVGYSTSDMESILLIEVLEYTNPQES